MLFERKVFILAVFIEIAFGRKAEEKFFEFVNLETKKENLLSCLPPFTNVSKEEAILAAATSSAVYESSLADIKQQLDSEGTKLIDGPHSCIDNFTHKHIRCTVTVHDFKDARSRLDMKLNFIRNHLLG